MTSEKLHQCRELVSSLLLQLFQSDDDRSPVSAGVASWVECHRDPPITVLKGYDRLSVRSVNILDIMRIRTPEDLGRLTEIEILEQRNAGAATLTEIKTFAQLNGIHLAD